MLTVKAHFDGRVFVPDEPVDCPPGRSAIVTVGAAAASADKSDLLTGLPLIYISPDDARGIAEEAEFDIEERRPPEDDVF